MTLLACPSLQGWGSWMVGLVGRGLGVMSRDPVTAFVVPTLALSQAA